MDVERESVWTDFTYYPFNVQKFFRGESNVKVIVKEIISKQ
jgi:hypothetical protein